MDLAWTKSTDEVLKYFDVQEDNGLSDSQIKRNQEKYGPNGKCLKIITNISRGLTNILFVI